MTPTFTVKFDLDNKEVVFTDTFDYGSFIFDNGFGNVIAKLGNTIFHSNSQFNSSADIKIGITPGNSFRFKLPVDGSGKVLPGAYEFTYNVQLVDEVLLYAGTGSGYITSTAGASPVTTVSFTSPPPNFVVLADALLDTLSDVRVEVYNSSNTALGNSAVITPQTSSVTCASLTYSGTVAKSRIIGTNIYSTSSSFAWNGCEIPTADLCVTSDCFYSQLTASDTTVYPAFVGSITRQLTIQYPKLANGTPVATTVTTTEATKTIGPNIWTGGYTISLVSVLSWTQDDGLQVGVTINAYEYPNVQCSNDLCKAFTCIESFRTKYMEAVRTGSTNLPALREQNFMILLYCNSYGIAMACKDNVKAAAILSELINYMGNSDCNCGCGCSDGESQGEPTEIFPAGTNPSQTNYLLWST